MWSCITTALCIQSWGEGDRNVKRVRLLARGCHRERVRAGQLQAGLCNSEISKRVRNKRSPLTLLNDIDKVHCLQARSYRIECRFSSITLRSSRFNET